MNFCICSRYVKHWPPLLCTTNPKLKVTWRSAVLVGSHHAQVSQLQPGECLGPYLYCDKMPEVRKQRSSPGSLYCPLHSRPPQRQLYLQPGLSKGSSPGGIAPSKGPSDQSLCLLLEISVLKPDSRSHIAGINCTSLVLQSRTKMCLRNLKPVLLSKMFHLINCKRQQPVISYARLCTLS